MKTKLSDCVEILDSLRVPLSSAERSSLDKVYPYYGAQGIIDYVDRYIFDGEYILVAEDGNNLKALNESIATWATGKFWVNNHAHILGEKTGFCLRFIYYMLQSVDLRGYITGSAQPKLTQENLARVELDLPDYDVQCRVAYTLTLMDSKIANNNAICSNLEAMAKLLYDYWFVQFDFPDENGKPYKSSGGKMVWNDELKREIPAGWEVKPLSDLCSFMNGINYDKNEVGNKKYRIVNVRNITASSLLLDDSDFDEIVLKSSQAERYLIADSDILIARSGTPGATRLLLNNDGNTIFCGFIIRCAPNDVALRYYLTYVLKRLEGTTATKTGGSILQNVSQDTLGRVMVIVPNETITDSFTKRIEGLHSLMQNAMIENQQLASLRDFLLPMLMNGQVKVGA